MKRKQYAIWLLVFLPLFARAQTQAGATPVFSSGNYYVVHAKLTKKNSGENAAGMRAYVSVPGPYFQMATDVSNEKGELNFVLKDMDQAKQLIFQTGVTNDSGLVFTVAPGYVSKLPLPAGVDSFPVYDTTCFYGYPDKTYILDDYTRFPTMEEVLREFVFEAKSRKSSDNYRLFVLNLPYRIYFDDEPLVLLDGVPVNDPNKIMQLDPLKLQKIEIVARKYYLGTAIYSGIISLFSYTGDLGVYTLPACAMLKEYDVKFNNPGAE
jgi:hypothetical protein